MSADGPARRSGHPSTDELRLGTRGSPLAVWQAETVRSLLRTEEPELEIRVEIIRTSAEKFPEKALAAIGVGVFSQELDRALLDGEIDLAVHSLKDLPSALTPGLVLAAVPERASPFDAWISATGAPLLDAPRGARVGTSSPRRKAQLLARRPDLEVLPIRGNVETRIARVKEAGLAGTILAEAGLCRLGREHVITEVLPPDLLLPAVSQGALGILVRADDPATLERVARLEDRGSRLRVDAERGFLRRLRGGCQVPAAAFAELVDEKRLRVRGLVAAADGSRVLRAEREGDALDGDRLGVEVADEILAAGGEALIRPTER